MSLLVSLNLNSEKEFSMSIDFIKAAKEFVTHDLKMTIMCGPLSTLEARLDAALERSFRMMEHVIRHELDVKPDEWKRIDGKDTPK